MRIRHLILALAGAVFPALAQAGGPWLVYTAVIEGEGSILVVNLGYSTGPQYAMRESDPDEEHNLRFNPKTKTIRKVIWDGNNQDDSSTQNEWHRLSWGRQGKTFALLYSQYEFLGPEGTQDHGVFLATGTCVAWPKGKRDIGITGWYPLTLNIQMLRLDSQWEGDPLQDGSRQLKRGSFVGKLDVQLTQALNGARAGLAGNLEAKNWIKNYFITTLGYTPLDDLEEY